MRRIVKNLTWMALAALALCMAVVIYAGVRQMRADVAATSANAQARQEVSAVERFRTLREQLRAMEKAQLNDVAHGADTDAELKAMAQRQLLELCTREEQELTLEGVLELRGYSEPIVTVHADSVNVLIQAEVITRQESAAILELVCRETGAQAGNVKIIPVN